MLKFLEKGPFSRWKFVRRIVHRHRNSRRSTTDKFKTFDSCTAPRSDSEHILSHDGNQSDIYDHDLVDGHVEEAEESEIVSNEEVNNVNNDRSDGSEPKASKEKSQKKSSSSKVGHQSPLMMRVEETKNGKARIKAWEEHHGTDVDTMEHDCKESDSVLDGSQSFQRSNGLRRSLKEIKKRSMNQVSSMRESMRKKFNSRSHSYGNLDDQADEDIVKYDRSPGSKRRQTTSSFRRSMRRSGKFVVQAMSQMPTVNVAQGMARASLLMT